MFGSDSRRVTWQALAWAAVAFVAAGCASVFGDDDPEYRIRFQAESASSVAQCEYASWGWTLIDRAGTEFVPVNAEPRWSAHPSGIVSIDPTHGSIQGRQPGVTEITLQVNGARASRPIEVLPFVPSTRVPSEWVTIRVSVAGPVPLVHGDTALLLWLYESGGLIHGGDRPDEWMSDNPHVATVDQCGWMKTYAAGTVRVTGRLGARSASQAIVVE
jgi:hypothetical protein